VNVLLRYGAPLDQQDAAGMTPLHSAVIHDRSSVTMILIKAGCSVDIADARGCTPLHLAATSGQLALARILVEAAGASLQVAYLPGLCPSLSPSLSLSLSLSLLLPEKEVVRLLLPIWIHDRASHGIHPHNQDTNDLPPHIRRPRRASSSRRFYVP